jgi:VIT1/CCC1 family predicted Fe2+/Mn2+ transporter
VPADVTRSLENLKLERDAIVLYGALASIEKDPRRAGAFRGIASNERRHADVWARKLEAQGVAVPAPDARPRLRVATIILLARLFGTRAVSDLVTALEGDEEAAYEGQSSPEVAAIAADEREHAEIWRRLQAKPGAASAASGAPMAASAAASAAPSAAGEARVVEDIAARERWHRSGRSGTLRAVIFGVSDGLVSNLALVMGVAGAAGDEGRFILLAGIAGLLAGAFSMAAGEYISMQSQRELFERQIALERAEIEEMPEEEEAELAALYRGKGFTSEESGRIAARIFGNPELALDTLVREELGLDPDELGSPIGAAGGSFVAFGIGALVPVAPYIVTGGSGAFVASIGLSIVALFAVGAGVSLLTGRSVLFSGTRQVIIGAAAAAVTYVVGSVIGVAVA